jgi:2-methylcitrate dehydratase
MKSARKKAAAPTAWRMDEITRTFAKFASSLSYGDLTPETVHQAQRRVIDSMGCAMGGYTSEPAKIARRLAAMFSGTLRARVLGTGQSSSPEMAAFANTVMVRYLDCNDASSKHGGHPSDMIGPLLAIAEAFHVSGKEFILAMVCAYEVLAALAQAVRVRERGWDQGFYVVTGSAVGAAKLLGLSAEQMGHAISLAVTPNIPTRQTRAGELSMWKGCATAAAARNGVFAALLAQQGMTGPYKPFEGHHGVWEQVTGPVQAGPLGGDGRPFEVEKSNLKSFPAEYHAQAPLWLALEIRKKVKPEDIAALNVKTYWLTYSEIGSEPEKWDPQTRETADHSLPFLLAAALQDGKITPATFTEERIRDRGLRPLMNKIKISEDPEFTRQYPDVLPTEIEVVTRSGERFVERATHPKGDDHNPMSDGEVEAKFLGLCGELLTPQQCRTALATLWHLEELPDVGVILDLFLV